MLWFTLLSVNWMYIVYAYVTSVRAVHVLVFVLHGFYWPVDCKWLFACDEGKRVKQEADSPYYFILKNAQVNESNNYIIIIIFLSRTTGFVYRTDHAVAKGGIKITSHADIVLLHECAWPVRNLCQFWNFQLDYSINLHKLKLSTQTVCSCVCVYVLELNCCFCGAEYLIRIDFFFLFSNVYVIYTNV